MYFRIHYGFHGAKDIIFGTYSKKWAFMKKISAQGLRCVFTASSDLYNLKVQTSLWRLTIMKSNVTAESNHNFSSLSTTDKLNWTSAVSTQD